MLSFEEQMTWRKLVKRSDYLVTFGRTISYLIYDAMHETNQISQREEPAQSSPKAQIFNA